MDKFNHRQVEKDHEDMMVRCNNHAEILIKVKPFSLHYLESTKMLVQLMCKHVTALGHGCIYAKIPARERCYVTWPDVHACIGGWRQSCNVRVGFFFLVAMYVYDLWLDTPATCFFINWLFSPASLDAKV